MLFQRPPKLFACLLVLTRAAKVYVYASPVLDARQPTSTLPAGWISTGCYSDSTAARTLRIAAFTDVNSMTIESCIAFCTPAGYNFAGVEFARECYCDNIIESPGTVIDASTCATPCTGNSNEICGGSNAISIFQNTQTTPVLPAGWSTVGCFSDLTTARTLRTAAFTDVTNMTIESCIAFCTPAKYNFAGLEFSRECYCDNIIETPGAPIDPINCNMPCTGNPAEICGGTAAIKIFKNTAIPPPPPPPPVASIKKTVGSFKYAGCFTDAVNGAPRSLATQLIGGGGTAETCTAICKAHGFVLAGLEFGGECWCDSYMPLAIPAPDSDCSSICDGDHTELCGAGNRLAVYQDTSAPALNSQTCLNKTQLHVFDDLHSFGFNLQMVPTTGGGVPVLLGVLPDSPPFPGRAGTTVQFFSLSGRNFTGPEDFGLALVGPEGHFLLASRVPNGTELLEPLEPSPGMPATFEADIDTTDFEIYCAMPNPASSFGSYIGPPALGVTSAEGANNGRSDLWASCQNGPGPLDPIFSPTSKNINCTSVVLEMTQELVSIAGI